jgi:hypothetical protein
MGYRRPTRKARKPRHGVGMSQIGAMWAAKTASSYNEILAFYYNGTVLLSAYGKGRCRRFEDVTEPEGGTSMICTS